MTLLYHYKNLNVKIKDEYENYKVDYKVVDDDFGHAFWKFQTEINGETVFLKVVGDAHEMAKWHETGILELMMNIIDIELHQEIMLRMSGEW